ncbi:MAG: type II toxin-antitoxin system RelB/DinJ family antitoxin [Sulfurifustaceae bacterium]
MASPSARRTPAEIKFRVDPAEKAQADAIAASVGMDTNTAMKVMFRRFLAERGFPFDMKAPARPHAAPSEQATPFGVNVARLAQISSAGFAAAGHAHEKPGRRRLHAVPVARKASRNR